jgi:hypothetical protein
MKPNRSVLNFLREGKTLFPNAAMQLQAADIVLILADRQSESSLRKFLHGSNANKD